jgi:hypothetical protein
LFFHVPIIPWRQGNCKRKKGERKENLFFQESPFSILAKRKEKVYNCLIMEEIQETLEEAQEVIE